MTSAVYMLEQELSDPRFDGWMFKKGAKARSDPSEFAYFDFRVKNSMSIHWEVRSLASIWRPQRLVGKVAPFNDYPCVLN